MPIAKVVLVIVLGSLPNWCQPAGQIEPHAGTWKTWIISSGQDYLVPPPPDAAATKAEISWMREFIASSNDESRRQVVFWDAGAPAYRWMDLLENRSNTGQNLTAFPVRLWAYVAMAMHDATVATWASKYAYNRPRPSQIDPSLPTSLAVPASPSYPSEHAATSAAAAEVLSFFFPAEAAQFRSLAEEAARSRMFAGLQYPSDYSAGMELGRKVAARVIERARADGSAAPWTGSVPSGNCMWTGTNPGNVTGGIWTPLLLTAPNEFRPAAPPACDSSEMVAQTATVRNFPRTPAAFATNQRAMYWQSPEGLNTWPFVYANKWMFEDKLDRNPPRAARVYSLIAAVFYDAFIASQDAKFTYWFPRPHQLDSSIVPLFPVPNFPSYPSNHATFSAARSAVLAYLFPTRADFIRAVGKEAGDSRIWAGIHYQIDLDAGFALGDSVASKFIARASTDGSQ